MLEWLLLSRVAIPGFKCPSMHKRSSSRAASTKDKQGSALQTSSSSSRLVTSEIAIAGTKLYTLISEVTTIANGALERSNKTDGKQFQRMLWKSSLLATEEGLVERIESCVTELRTSTILVQLLEQTDSTTAEADVKRIAAKVDRALERLRRSASTWLERYSAARDCTYSQFKELLLTITTVLETSIQQVGLPMSCVVIWIHIFAFLVRAVQAFVECHYFSIRLDHKSSGFIICRIEVHARRSSF